MTKPRVLAILLGLLAIGGVVYACMTDQWLVNVAYGRGFGLRSGWECTPECWTMTNADMVEALRTEGEPGMSAAFAPMGWATLGLLALGGLSLAIATLLAAVRAQPRLPLTPTTVALVSFMLALITGCVFVATKPGPPGFVGVGTSFWVFGGTAVFGIAAAQQLARVNRPPDPDLLEDAMNPEQF